MSDHQKKKVKDSPAVDSQPGEPEQPSPPSDEMKRRRRQRVYKALLVAKGQLIVIPDEIIH